MLEISKKNSLKLWREFLEIFQKVPLTILLGTLRKKKKKEAKWRVFATKKITASLYGIVHNLVLERRERERERERELCVCLCVFLCFANGGSASEIGALAIPEGIRAIAILALCRFRAL
jgi:hypothetical protein